MSGPLWVIPCFDEAGRLDEDALVSLAGGAEEIRLLLVDDGSRDTTAERLSAVAARAPERIDVLRLPHNRGKAEAVRHGLRQALRDGAEIVGYADADLATPVDELRRLAGLMRESDDVVLMASRVALLGRTIERSPVRHYAGRVFATAASLVLGLPVYDTQCGAKLFRRGPELEAALRRPFRSRWIFDVELLGRLLTGTEGAPPLAPSRVREEPLLRWRDVPGSKLRGLHAVSAALSLVRIALDLRAHKPSPPAARP